MANKDAPLLRRTPIGRGAEHRISIHYPLATGREVHVAEFAALQD
jgi:hypothetical protein